MERKTSITARMILLCAMAYGILSLIALSGDIQSAVAEKDRVAAQLTEARAQVSQLEYALDSLDDPAVIERIARKELGMTRPFESVFCYTQSGAAD